MAPSVLLSFFLLAVQTQPVDLSLVTVPIGERVDVPLSARSEVEIRRAETQSGLRVRIDEIGGLTSLDPRMRAYVAWTVSPEGDFENLGELEVNGRRAELDTTTSLQRFGILVTAEPHFMVQTPSRLIGFRSASPSDDDVRVEPLSAEVGRHDYSAISLPPQGNVPPHVTQARMAYRLAEALSAAEFAPADLRAARVALDSMEELLRRNTPMGVLLPYATDSIRLSARAARLTESQRLQRQLQDTTGRAEALDQQNRQMEQELERLGERSRETSTRLSELQLEVQAQRTTIRRLELEAEDAQRQVRSLESEVARLSDPWLGLQNALMRSVGARATARGLAVTLPGSYFQNNGGELQTEGREFLSRVAGVLSVDELLDIRIEGHSGSSGPASRRQALSEERAEAVKAYLIDQGLPEEDLLAEGFGAARPLAASEGAEAQAINNRVEILFRGIRTR